MKPGFYISMGVAIAGLVVGFILLNDIQQEKEAQKMWIQKIPTQCNDVWSEEYKEYSSINPDVDMNSKEILENIIQSHYENQGIDVLEIDLEQDFYEGMRCEACTCLGWDKLSMKIPKEQFSKLPTEEGWEKSDSK